MLDAVHSLQTPTKQAAGGLSWAGCCRMARGSCSDKTQPVGLDHHFLMDGSFGQHRTLCARRSLLPVLASLLPWEPCAWP